MESLKKSINRITRKVGKAVGAALGDGKSETLAMWQERFEKARHAADDEYAKMDGREDLYAGTREIQPAAGTAKRGMARQASTVRNIVSELIESQIDSSIPMPVARPLDPDDEKRAIAIEQMLRTDMDRLPLEYLNDEQERTNPIQGGSWMLVEWDTSIRTHSTAGDVTLTLLHPKQVVPQPGVRDYRKLQWAFVQDSVTKERIRAEFGVDVETETEASPEVAVASASKRPSADAENVTLIRAFYLNSRGGVGLFAWVNDTVVADYPDYLCRHAAVCAACGADKRAAKCACGSGKFERILREYEELAEDVPLSNGDVIPAATPETDELGRPVIDPATGQPRMKRTRIPYYRVDRLPLVLRKNVSVFGKLLGESDVDKIRDQQELVKKLGTKIEEKLLKGGSYITLPNGVSFRKDDSELKVIQVRSAADTQAIDVKTLQPNIGYDAAEKEKAYYEAKSTLGITDSFQGQPDRTATSGVAKRFAAGQSAGRLESKRRMKDAFYADVFELMFRLKLAFADEPRPTVSKNMQGKPMYGEFNRYDFVKRDAAGELYYEDRFFFSVDSSSGLSANREAMWQEARMNLQQGAFGQPGTPRSLVLFWTLMQAYHYPNASMMLEMAEQWQREAEQQAQQQQQAAAGAAQGALPPGMPEMR